MYCLLIDANEGQGKAFNLKTQDRIPKGAQAASFPKEAKFLKAIGTAHFLLASYHRAKAAELMRTGPFWRTFFSFHHNFGKMLN